MAFIDTQLTFSSFTTPVAITSTADSSIIDVTGYGVGVAPVMTGAGGLNTAIGTDIGNGDGATVPWLYLVVTTAFVSGGGATLTVSLKAAPDSGTYTEGTYTTLYQSIAFSVAQLVVGQVLFVPVPPRVLSTLPGEALPRFYKLTYTVGTSTFSAGKVGAGLILNPPMGIESTLIGNNINAV